MKLLFIICDGLGDRPSPVLNNQTPLEAANTPNMDKLAEMGMNGLMDVIGPGVVPGSDTAHLALFGVDPFKYYSGRGPFEAAGIGLNVKKGDVAFRVNFATRNDDGIIIDRRAGRIKKGTHELAQLFNGMKIDDVEIIFKEGTEHRAALVLRGEGLSDKVSGNDPKKEGKKPYPFKPLDNSAESQKTVEILTKFIEKAVKLLSESDVNKKRIKVNLPPANYLLIRGAGKVPHLPNFEKEHGLKTACVAGGGLYKGVGRMLGMDIVEREGITGGLDTNLQVKFGLAEELLETHDFVFVHVKATDNLSHDGNAVGKKEFIEKIDKELYRFLPEKRDDLVLFISGDHSSPCVFKDHSADPVPLIIYSPTCRRDHVKKFGERYSYQGILGRIQGKQLLNILLNEMKLLSKYGA